MEENNNFEYNKIPPFKWFVLENFPFIEADFDALTNWQLFCKLGKEMNTVIDSVNLSGEQVENLTNAFNVLQTYVNNYFDNLDVQEEIDHKLDEMVEDGTITNLIKGYVDPIYEEFETEITTSNNSFKNEINTTVAGQNARISQVEDEVESATSGTPLIASSTAGMTDTTRLYVNTTDGYVYYYSNNQWTKGWQYQAQENSDDVGEMKKDFYKETSTDLTYEVGTINSDNGNNSNNGQRVRLNDYLDLNKYKLITIDSDYDLNIFAYTDSSYLGTTSWLTEKEYYTDSILSDYPTATRIRLIFRSHVERTMTLDDVTASDIKIYELNFATKDEVATITDGIIDAITFEGETITPNFVQGSISSATGRIDTAFTNRICDTTFYKASEIKQITCDSDYRILIANYTSNDEDTFTNVVTWQESPVTEFTGTYIRIGIKKYDDSDITPSTDTGTEIETKVDSLKEYVENIQSSVDNIIKSSQTPNIIWQCRNVTDTICPPFSKDYVKLAVENEFDRIIVYVRKTTDGYYVSIHDDTINTEARNMDGSTISQTISSNGQSLATLNSYDWGIKYGSEYAGMQVPMVEDVMKWASQYNIACSVHFSYGFTQEDAEDIFEMACKYGLVDNMIVLPSNRY